MGRKGAGCGSQCCCRSPAVVVEAVEDERSDGRMLKEAVSAHDVESCLLKVLRRMSVVPCPEQQTSLSNLHLFEIL